MCFIIYSVNEMKSKTKESSQAIEGRRRRSRRWSGKKWKWSSSSNITATATVVKCEENLRRRNTLNSNNGSNDVSLSKEAEKKNLTHTHTHTEAKWKWTERRKSQNHIIAEESNERKTSKSISSIISHQTEKSYMCSRTRVPPGCRYTDEGKNDK